MSWGTPQIGFQKRVKSIIASEANSDFAGAALHVAISLGVYG